MATTITANDLLAMIQSPQPFTMIDLRSRSDYEASRLCNSFNLIHAPILLRRLRAGCLPLTKAIQNLARTTITDDVFESGTVVVYGYGDRDCDSERLAAVLSGCIASQYTCHTVDKGYAGLIDASDAFRPYMSSSSPSSPSKRRLKLKRPLSLKGLPLRPLEPEPATPRHRACCQRSSGAEHRLSCVRPGLYVGCLHDATDEPLLLENNITHVMSVIEKAPEMPAFVHQHHLAIRDAMAAAHGLLPHLKTLAVLIHEAIASGGRVLVHCSAGISRSPTVAIAYLMIYHHMTMNAAMQLVTDKRPVISPNLAFLGVLQQLEAELKSASVADQLSALRIEPNESKHEFARNTSCGSLDSQVLNTSASSKGSASCHMMTDDDRSDGSHAFVDPI
eukprot:TRINITY_DN5962_c0_g1_i2.p1 TRINITY_DN5962_c0_g1~~TRINITY_DN5962_c0_g1_i2.p1  ORF type:complete len:391 (+),score=55.00 TRINITY_DN5962_c0_g1_i2:170-1342(+)